MVEQLNTHNRTEFEFNNRDNVEISACMQFYIDYANKLFYPESVTVQSDNDLYAASYYISVTSKSFADSNRHSYFVQFDHQGKFKMGNSRFCHVSYENILDQNEFKAMIKRDIYRVNVVHGTVNKMLSK